MQQCFAPSEISGVSSGESSIFGHLAEDIIFADFVSRYPTYATDVFQDSNNLAAYFYFLAKKNPSFTQAKQLEWYPRVTGAQLVRVPDILVHTSTERAFYEVKPDSVTGRRAGEEKVAHLDAKYAFSQLPYRSGQIYVPRDYVAATLGVALKVTLRVRRAQAGLILYKLCVDAHGIVESATLAVLLRYVVQQLNKMKGTGSFRPVDLGPAFAPRQPLAALSRTLGFNMAARSESVGWKYFWKAVSRRFAVRGAAGLTLAAADGPLPVGDLLAAGLAVWTIIDIVRLSDELWSEAGRLSQQRT